MALYKIRCRLSYHYLKIALIEIFANIVRDGIFNNPLTFVTPPMTLVAFQALITDFANKLSLFESGGTAQLGPYRDAKKALMLALDELSTYVTIEANNNPNTILLSGFEPTKSNSSKVNAPLQPQTVTLTRGLPGTLSADCAKVTDAESYGGILVANNPIPDGMGINPQGQVVSIYNPSPMPTPGPMPIPGSIQFIQDLNKARRKKFTGLAIGTTYYFYMWAMNAGGVSPLSVVVSKKVVEG